MPMFPVTFIVVSYNRVKPLQGCLDSIRDHACSGIVVEVNGDNPDADRLLETWRANNWRDVPTLINWNVKDGLGNIGWVDAINHATKVINDVTHDKDTIVVFLNDDVEFGPYTMPQISKAFQRGADIVGTSGFVLDANGWPKPETDRPKWVEGNGMAVPLNLFVELGGFHESFGFGYLEDADFCFRAVRQGYKLRVTRKHDFNHLTLHDHKFAIESSRKNLALLRERYPEEFAHCAPMAVTA